MLINSPAAHERTYVRQTIWRYPHVRIAGWVFLKQFLDD